MAWLPVCRLGSSFAFNDEMTNITAHTCKKEVLHLGTTFSGIGAVECSLGKLNISHKICFAGDIDSFCRKTYFANYPIKDEDWHTDVRTFNATKYLNKIDLYVGGSPCQSFSIMGKRKGFEEARGTLFYDYARIINECKPKVFIFENVTGMLNHDQGRTWRTITCIFDSLGYDWTYWVLNAKDFGIPHNRRRVFVVGFRKEDNKFFKRLKEPTPKVLDTELKDWLDNDVPNKYYLPIKGFIRVTSPNESKHVALNGKIARCQVACQQYNWFGDMRFETHFPLRVENDERIHKGEYNGERGVTRTLTPHECLRLMGYPDDFKIVVNDTQLYRQCGNSIAVNVMSEVVSAIIRTGIFNHDCKSQI